MLIDQKFMIADQREREREREREIEIRHSILSILQELQHIARENPSVTIVKLGERTLVNVTVESTHARTHTHARRTHARTHTHTHTYACVYKMEHAP